MFRKILLCYDGSEQGRDALKEGAEVALCMNAETHLLAIVREPAGAAGADEFNSEQRCAARILRQGVEWLLARNLQARGQLVTGDPVEHIGRCARELGADLIVLARRSSKAEHARLLEGAPCSILVSVGAPAPEPGPRGR